MKRRRRNLAAIAGPGAQNATGGRAGSIVEAPPLCNRWTAPFLSPLKRANRLARMKNRHSRNKGPKGGGDRPRKPGGPRPKGVAGKPFRRRDEGGEDRVEALSSARPEQGQGRRLARTQKPRAASGPGKAKRRKPGPVREAGGAGGEQRWSKPDQLWIYGRHAVIAALRNPRRPVKRVLATASAAEQLRIERIPAERLALVTVSPPDAIDAALHDGAVHQGFAAMVGDLERARLKETCAPDGDNRPVVVLDQITDPQNIGAIFRSAAAFGARAIIVQDRRTPPRAGALAKAAAGAVEILPCVEVVNVARALEALKGLGYFCAGLSGAGGADIADMPRDRPAALVLGAEGAGLRQLVAATCDGLYRIPIDRAVESLNVSTAAAVSLYAITRKA